MDIKNIKINNYGKLNDKNINFEKINIIFGKNESGKSTLLNYIISIFYNISKNKNGKEISDFEKYKPWNNKDFSGKIVYQLDNKREYEVFRDFSKKNPEIYDQDYNVITNMFNIDKKIGNTFFYDQTNIDRETLLSTVVTEQNETKLNVNSQNLLIQKIANLADTGSEDVSYKKAITKIDKELLIEVGTEKSSDRPINTLKKELEKLTIQYDEIKNVDENKYEIENKKNKIIGEIEEQDRQKQIYNDINNLIDLKNNQEEKIKINKKIIEENNIKINNLNIDNKRSNNKKKNIISVILVALAVLINIINFIINKNKIINYLLLLLIPISIINYLIKNKKKNKVNNKNQIEVLNNNNNSIENEINLSTDKLNKEIRKQKDNLIKKYGEDINDLIDSDDISYLIKDNYDTLNTLKLELHKLELDAANIEPKSEKKAEIKEKIELLNNELQILTNKADSYKIAKEIIETAYKEMKNSVSPKFSNNLSENISIFSNNKYKKVILNNGISVEMDNGQYVSADQLSIGTIEQIYLALRLSVLKEISGEKIPIILDEPFAYYDDERLEETLKFLMQTENQVIIFSCTDREKDILNKLNANYNLIEL